MTTLSWVIRTSIVVAALMVIGAALVTPEAAPMALSWVVAAAAVACAVGAAAMPDGHAATATIGLLLWYWLLVVDIDTSVMTPIAAAGIVVVHVASSVEAITPPGSRLAQQTYRRWGRRTMAVIGAGFALWLAAFGADRIEHAGGVPLVVLFGLLAGGGIWALRLRVLGD